MTLPKKTKNTSEFLCHLRYDEKNDAGQEGMGNEDLFKGKCETV